MFEPGQLVRIAPEWCDDPAEREFIFTVLEMRGADVLTEWTSCPAHWRIKPVSQVRAFMLRDAD